MFSVGLDIHDQRIAICVLSEAGQVARRAQVRTIDEMMRILEALPDRFEVCSEASCGYGHYHDSAQPGRSAGHGAHPDQLRLLTEPSSWTSDRTASQCGTRFGWEGDVFDNSRGDPPAEGRG